MIATAIYFMWPKVMRMVCVGKSKKERRKIGRSIRRLEQHQAREMRAYRNAMALFAKGETVLPSNVGNLLNPDWVTSMAFFQGGHGKAMGFRLSAAEIKGE